VRNSSGGVEEVEGRLTIEDGDLDKVKLGEEYVHG